MVIREAVGEVKPGAVVRRWSVRILPSHEVGPSTTERKGKYNMQCSPRVDFIVYVY